MSHLRNRPLPEFLVAFGVGLLVGLWVPSCTGKATDCDGDACGVAGHTGGGSAASTDDAGLVGGGAGGGAMGGGDAAAGGATGAGGGSTPSGGLWEADAGPDTSYDGGCGPPVPGSPSIHRRCARPTEDECDGPTDEALAAGGVPDARLNHRSGNGFDDDCDGLVDEGCPCPGGGVTRTCYLVPATQVDPDGGLPVGWCGTNAKGSADCAGDELATWSGLCRGAQPPAIVDSCSTGDFNCDGLDMNNAAQGCTCRNDVDCPTDAITEAPYPPPNAIPLLDGSKWIADEADRAQAQGWQWTILGGDCDNVLPHPTFALYRQANAAESGVRAGVRTPVALDPNTHRYVAADDAGVFALVAANYGDGVDGGRIYPAFGLSGDYIVQGEFTLKGRSYVCTQKVQVRAPGIRAELCWDSVGKNDLDLHFARLQGRPTCVANGWSTTCPGQDCNYTTASGCASNSVAAPGWGYADSADSACLGWSSKRKATAALHCTNPRLDRDNIKCSRALEDPTSDNFCGPENINLDNPADGDRFVIGVNYYQTAETSAAAVAARAHANLYCNGERVLSAGYNPATGAKYPMLDTPGRDEHGDFWTVGTLEVHVDGTGKVTSCGVATAPSRKADTSRDGPANMSGGSPLCVEHQPRTQQFIDSAGQGAPDGSVPMTAAQWCKH